MDADTVDLFLYLKYQFTNFQLELFVVLYFLTCLRFSGLSDLQYVYLKGIKLCNNAMHAWLWVYIGASMFDTA